MQTEQYKLLGCDIDIEVPSTIQEAIDIAGPEKVLAAYNDHIVYHSVAGLLRNRVAPVLEKVFPAEPRLTETNDKGKEVITETPADYVTRLKKDAGLTDDQLTGELQKLASSPDCSFAKVAKAERTPSRAKPGKSFYEIVERAAGKPGGLPALAAKLGQELGREVNPNDQDDLARAVQAHRQKITAAYQAQVKAATAALLS